MSEEECFRTVERSGYYVILPVLPELRGTEDLIPAFEGEYSSRDKNISISELKRLLSGADKEISAFLQH